MKKLLIIMGLILGIAACGKSGKTNETDNANKTKAVKTISVDKKMLNGEVGGNGSFEPVSEAPQFGPDAEVSAVYFKNGDKVKEGNVVIQLNDIVIKSQYETARANLMSAEASLSKTGKFAKLQEENTYENAKAAMINAKESLEKARRGSKKEDLEIGKLAVSSAKQSYEQIKFNYDRNKKLYEEKLISQADFLNVETQYLSAKSNYEKAQKNYEIMQIGTDQEDIKKLEANYNQAKFYYELTQKNIQEKVWENTITSSQSSYIIAKANYDIAKKNYDDLTVKAKISGTVANLDIKRFEKATKNNTLFYVIDDSQMNIKIGLSASEVLQVKKGANVDIYVEELGEKAIQGIVSEIDPSADPKTNKFAVTITVKNSESKVKKGMYGKAEIKTEAKEMMVVPKRAIVVKNLYKYIFKVDNGVAKQIKVELGNSTDELQEIFTNEIKPGDKIVIDGQYLLQNSDSVKEVK